MAYAAPARQDSKTKMKHDAEAFLSGIILTGRAVAPRRDSLESDEDEGDEPDSNIERVTGILQLQPIQLASVRIVYALSTPLLVSSVLPYQGKRWRQQHRAEEADTEKRRTREHLPYDHLLHPGSTVPYDALLLDDPELRHGKHQKVLQFISYRTSITLHTKPADLKRDINATFRERLPHIALTLTKLRSLKRDIVFMLCVRMGLDVAVAALAHVYFERVVLRGVVNKQSRKMLAAACMVLSIKVLIDGAEGGVLPGLWPEVADMWGLSKQQILSKEFHVFSLLEFHLHMPPPALAPHLQRITRTLPEAE